MKICDFHKPIMLTLPQLAEETGIGYSTLYTWCKQGRFPYIKAGKRFLVNLERFYEFLNSDEREALNDR